MLRLVSDENFNGDIVHGLVLRRPGLDLVRLQDTGLEGAEDPYVFVPFLPLPEHVSTDDIAVFCHHTAL